MSQHMSVQRMGLIVIGLMALLGLVYGQALQQATMPASQRVFQAMAERVIADSNNIDPDDFCRDLNAAFAAAGSPNLCTAASFTRHSDHVAEIRFNGKNEARGEETMAQLEVGLDESDIFESFGIRPPLPKDVGVFTTNVRVFAGWEGRGIGRIIVENYQTFLKRLGARPGDVEFIVASPDVSRMSVAKQQAWINFIKQLCEQLGGNPLPVNRGGCWIIIQ